MKKFATLTLAALATALLAGCGSSAAADDTIKVDASKPSSMSMDKTQGGGNQKAAAPTGLNQ